LIRKCSILSIYLFLVILFKEQRETCEVKSRSWKRSRWKGERENLQKREEEESEDGEGREEKNTWER
jgi:hypothetical protein